MNKNNIDNIILILIGNLVLAFAVGVFILPYNILSGGVAGFAVVFDSLLGLDKEFVVNFLVIVLFLIGWLVLGKDFALKTVLSSISYPIFLSIIIKLFPVNLSIPLVPKLKVRGLLLFELKEYTVIILSTLRSIVP